jgi:membrane protein YqaA with SNARE-associated domain
VNGQETLLVYSALVGWSFAGTMLPMGSEPAPFAGAVRPFFLTTTTGNVLGACALYWLARRSAASSNG